MSNLREIVAFIRSQACGGDNFNAAVLYVAEQVERHFAGTSVKTVDSEDAAPQAWRDVLAERRRQVSVDGWSPEHDDEHSGGGMAIAAACYSIADKGRALAVQTVRVEQLWQWTGWAWHWFKPKNQRHNLVRAGALILAEIERLDRASARGISTTKREGA